MRLALAPVCALCLLAACGSGASDSPPVAEREAAIAIGRNSPPVSAAPAAMTGPAMSKDELAKAVCFYTPDEISKALGFTVAAGKPDTAMLQSYGMASCTYVGSENSLGVRAIWIDPAQVPAARSGMTRLSGGGRIELVPGDPDSAYLHDQQDNGTSLHYLRRNIQVQLHATSGRTPFATMKPKLLKLRRVP